MLSPHHQPGVLSAGGHHLPVLREGEVGDGPLVVRGEGTGGMSGHRLHQSPVFLPPAGGPGAQLGAGRAGQLRPHLLSPQSVRAGYPEPPPADQRTGENVRTGQPGEHAQHHVLVQVLPVRHLSQSGHHYSECRLNIQVLCEQLRESRGFLHTTFKQTKHKPDKEKFLEVFITINSSVC